MRFINDLYNISSKNFLFDKLTLEQIYYSSFVEELWACFLAHRKSGKCAVKVAVYNIFGHVRCSCYIQQNYNLRDFSNWSL